jgi:hypothetical protein
VARVPPDIAASTGGTRAFSSSPNVTGEARVAV